MKLKNYTQSINKNIKQILVAAIGFQTQHLVHKIETKFIDKTITNIIALHGTWLIL